MKDPKQTVTKKTWSTPRVEVIELNTAKAGTTGATDSVPQSRS